MSAGKNTYAEMPTTQQIFHYENAQLIHQPILVAVDVSASMDHTEVGQTKTNIKLAEEMLNQIGQDPKMRDDYKRTTDFCVMSFSDYVTTERDWGALSEYNGGISLTPHVTTAFHEVVKQALNAVRTIRHDYAINGIQCKRPQIFIITDGYSTDPRDNQQAVLVAKELCQRYVDTNKVALHVILLPGGDTSDSKGLSSNVKLYRVDDCSYGLPAIEQFINASIVSISSSSLGTIAKTALPNEIKTTQPVEKQSDGTRVVAQEVDAWN